jgi:hypothetical protein
MIIEARKQSPDPIQEALRERKAKWNKKVSAFIDNFINLKKTINGSPSKLHTERSKITEPIPDVASILNALASEFRDLLAEGNEIIAQQLSYSKTRRKKQPKQNKAPNLSEQLSLPATASIELQTDVFEKYASNVLTRFLSKLKGPYFGKSLKAVERRYRLSLLSSVADLYKLCSKFQAEIVSNGSASIDRANKKLIGIEDSLITISKTISSFTEEKDILFKEPSNESTENNSTKEDPSTKEEPKEPKEPKEEPKEEIIDAETLQIESLVNEWLAVNTSIDFIDPQQRKDMNFLSNRFKQISVKNKKLLSEKIIKLYKNILLDLNTKLSINMSSLKEIAEFILKNASEQNNLVIQASLSNWFGKLRHQISPFDKTSSHRLTAFDAVERIRSKLDDMLDSLEKEFDPKYLNEQLNNIYSDFFIAKKALHILLPEVRYDDSYEFKGELGEKIRKTIQQKNIREISKRLNPSAQLIQQKTK